MSANWLPLESNPETLNTYMADLGVNTKKVNLFEVLSVEDWALEMVP